MYTKNNRFKCDFCGRFIPILDFNNNKAINLMVRPDSDYSTETWETTCKKCLVKMEIEL